MSSGQTDIVERYVKALYGIAKKNNQEDSFKSQLDSIQAILNESQELKSFLKNPLIKPEQFHDFLNTLSKEAKMNDEMTNFFKLLIENGRFSLLEKIIIAFGKFYIQEKGQIEVEVISSETLSKKAVEKIQKTLEKELGSELIFYFNIQPQILGGLKIRIGSKMIDASLQTQLNNLQNLLKGKTYAN